jgi:hypothetical protein
MNPEPSLPRDLDGGLRLRRSTPADADALTDFNSRIHSDDGFDVPDARLGAWTRDLLTRPHPTFHSDDFTIVEEAATGKIISSMNLISQTWAYEGIPFGVGRPELVGTLPEYRNRGLVRLQFDVVHQWSAERGELVQGITGIPYYYRLFGYEMALNLHGGQAGFLAQVPRLNEGQAEPYRLRPAQEADLPFWTETYAQGSRRRNLITCVWNEVQWRCELLDKSPENVNRLEMRLIESAAGERVGILAHLPYNWGAMLPAMLYELRPGLSWAAVTPSVVRYLVAQGQQYAQGPQFGQQPNPPFDSFGLWMGEQHPAYEVLGQRLPRVRQPYAWFIRVPDLPAFLRQIAPALEARLAASPMVGHSGETLISFYRDGLRLVFEKGRLVTAEAWKPSPQGHSGNATFPGLTFLQLVFGYRSLDELKYAFVDCGVDNDEHTPLLKALFPRKPSDLWPIS